jgi:hypothetical protein
MKPVSVDIAGIVHTNSCLDGIRGKSIGAMQRMQVSITSDTCLLTFCDLLTAFWWHVWNTVEIAVELRLGWGRLPGGRMSRAGS